MKTIHIIDCDRAYDIEIVEGATLLQGLAANGIAVDAPCGGKGICAKCLVRIEQGEAPATKQEQRKLTQRQLDEGLRLACCTVPEDGITVNISPMEQNHMNIMADKLSLNEPLKPLLRRNTVTLEKPDLKNQSSDAERFRKATGLELPLSLIKQLPVGLRTNGNTVSYDTIDGKVTALHFGDKLPAMLGAAFDIGTTTLAGYLFDLESGELLDIETAVNPQRVYGADVITRSDYAGKEGGLAALQSVLTEELTRMMSSMTTKCGKQLCEIGLITFVGNTVMMHLLAGVSPASIAVVPFVPVFTDLTEVKAADLGFKELAEGCEAVILPMLAGYVGADTVAAVLDCDMYKKPELALMVDIGTNGEMVLGNNEGLYACSTAAGPAFEGAHITCGMSGVKGAVSKVKLTADGVQLNVIGDAPAKGLCGSGLVDTIAELLNFGIIDDTGRLLDTDELEDVPEALAERLVELGDDTVFMLVSKAEGAENDVYLTQKDVRELQLAKAAIAAGIEVLIEAAGKEVADVEAVYLAGGFGNYIDIESACRIGLLPGVLKERIKPIGNAAGKGACRALLNEDSPALSTEIRNAARYIELSVRPDFQELFADCMFFEDEEL